MERYRISESVGRSVQGVHSYEDLEIHHPTANRLGVATGRLQDFENPRKRSYARVDGDFEEVRNEPDGRVLVKKDFILSREREGPVHVPSPVAGYVHYLRDPTAAVRIYDRPSTQAGAKLLAQSLHMDPRSFRIPEGGRVDYGQPLGRMSDTGTPGSIHAHVEAEADQFRRYIRNIDNGTIAPGRWPGRGRAGAVAETPHGGSVVPGAAPAHPAMARTPILETLELGDRGTHVQTLQRTLNRLGIRDAQGRPLVEDGDFGRRTRDAVAAFQREHALDVDGRVGSDTRTALAAPHGARITDSRHPDYALFEQVLGKLHDAEAARGLPSGPHSLNVAAALVARMKIDGIERADRVDFNDTSHLVRVVQAGRSGLPEHELGTVPMDTGRASRQSIHASSDQLAAFAQEQTRSASTLSRAEPQLPALAR